MTMFRPTRGARVSQPARTTMPGSSWNPTSIQSPQPMPRQNPGVQTTNPGGGSVMDGGAPQQPRQPSQNAQLSSGFQREQPPQPQPTPQFTSNIVGNDSITPVEYFPDGRMRMSDGSIYDPNALPAGQPMPGGQVPPTPPSTRPYYGGVGVDPQTQYQMDLAAWQARRAEAIAAGGLVPQVEFPTFEQWLAQRQPGGGDARGQQPPPMTNPPDNTTPAPNLPQPPMRYRPTPSPDKGMGGTPTRPGQQAPMQTQLPGDYNPTAGTIYDRPGMGPGYGAQPPLQRTADVDYAAGPSGVSQPPRRYTVRVPGVNRRTGNGIFTGR